MWLIIIIIGMASQLAMNIISVCDLLTLVWFPFQKSNYFGSLTQASTSSLGIGPDGKDVYIPFKDLLPMVEPNDIEFDGNLICNLFKK